MDIASSSNPQNFVNHLTPETFVNSTDSHVGVTSNDPPAKRRPGRPKGSGKKDAASPAPVRAPAMKRPVGRPRKDGLPAGSTGSSRLRKSAAPETPDTSASISVNPSHYGDPSNDSTSASQSQGHAGLPAPGGATSLPSNLSFDHDWAELARSKPNIFLTALLIALASLPPLPSTSGLSVEEAFKSHLGSLAPSPSQNHNIPSLYSILKTFWLPSSPAYFTLTASTSTARTPSDHRFLYWDPQPLVFNGIACPNCSSPLVNSGRIKSGPIKIYDIERPFFIIGCEYVCRNCVNATTGEGRKFASTDPSILRSLPKSLKDEFPARLLHSDADSGSGPEVWNWQPLGVSKVLWNLVRGLTPGLKKEGIIDLLSNVQRGYPGEDDKKDDDASHSNLISNGNSVGNNTSLSKAGNGGFTDAYNNAWKANTAVVGSKDVNAKSADLHTVAPSSMPTNNPAVNATPSQSTTGFNHQPYVASVYPHSSTPNFTSYQFSSLNGAASPKVHVATAPSGSSQQASATAASVVVPSSVVSPAPGAATPTVHSNTNSNPTATEAGTTTAGRSNGHDGLTTTTELGKRPYPFGPTAESDFQSSGPSANQLSVMSSDISPRKRSPRHCSKCGSPDCKGKGGRNFCTNPCKDCGKLECRGRNSRRPEKPCNEGWNS